MSEQLINYFKGDAMAANVWLSKYAHTDSGETMPGQMHLRMAREIARIEESYSMEGKARVTSGLSEYGARRKFLSEERIMNLFNKFKHLIPQGSIMATLGTPVIASISNCFVIEGALNSYGGILKTDEEQIQLMKRRGGVGHDLSKLQPADTKVNNAAKSSTGSTSFVHRFSESTREVAQNGRRGALMLTNHINHPDIHSFITLKRDLTKATGANLSVKIDDEFMRAVEAGQEYILRYPIDYDLSQVDIGDQYHMIPGELYDTQRDLCSTLEPGYLSKIDARSLWKEIIKTAHNVAEPGILFWDKITNYSPDSVYEQFKQICTNPCAEIAMQAYDACRLLVNNFYNYVVNPFTKNAFFDFKKFYEYNYEALRIMDDIVDLEIEHIDRILDKIELDPEDEETKRTEYNLWIKVKQTAQASRRTGLGFTALGDVLAALGITYGSEEAITFADRLGRVKLMSELDCMVDMSILRGSFEGWDDSLEFKTVNGVVKGQNPFYQMLLDEFPEETNRMRKFGRRNLSWSTVAPTGTVSILTQTTSGIEPLFKAVHTRRKKINPSDKGVRVDFVDDNGDSWQEFPVLHFRFKEWILTSTTFSSDDIDKMSKEMLQRLFEQSPWFGSTAEEIHWEGRIKMQSTIQKYISHSISSTINLPEDVSEEEVADIYMAAWKSGLKGITVYREGSRSGVLIGDKKEEGIVTAPQAPKRPKVMKSEGHTTVIEGKKYNVIVGMLGKKPYEVFMLPFVKELTTGTLTRIKSKTYEYADAKGFSIENITGKMSPEQEAITRMLSMYLRHGGEIQYAKEQLLVIDGEFLSFAKGLGRVIGKYIPNGVKSTLKCANPECESSNVVFNEGCMMCLDCGESACG